jgi:hypothetical protein
LAPGLAALSGNLLFVLFFFDAIRNTRIFQDSKNFVEAAAVLTFLEGILSIALGAFVGFGLGERVGMTSRALTTGRVDVAKYAEDRERSTSLGVRLIIVGALLLLFTPILSLTSVLVGI